MVKLIFNSQEFVCKDATTAAKLVDAMEAATPVNSIYVGGDLIVQAANNDHYYMYYAEKNSFRIENWGSDLPPVYESKAEAEATIERIKAVAAETAEEVKDPAEVAREEAGL